MDDPFANLTSGYIPRTSMKDAKKHAVPIPSRPPAGRTGSPNQGSPSYGNGVSTFPNAPQQQQQQGLPMGGQRYPSPAAQKSHMDVSVPMKHAGSAGSLDSLSGLSLGSKGPMGQKGMRPMRLSSDTAAEAKAPAAAPAAASPAPAPVPQAYSQPAQPLTANDFDSVFGSVSSGKPPEPDVVGVDVFGGTFPSGGTAAASPQSSSDPFAMFDDIGVTVVSHAPEQQQQATPDASDILAGFSDAAATQPPAAAAAAAEETFLPPADEPPPPAYSPPASDTPAPASANATPEDSSSAYMATLEAARKPQSQSSRGSPMEEQRPSALSPNPSTASNTGSPTAAGIQSTAASLFSKFGKEGSKLASFAVKHGARAAEQASKAVLQGVTQARDMYNENLHQGAPAWKTSDDGTVFPEGTSGGAPAAPEATASQIKMAETLLEQDPATREAILAAMDPEDRTVVDSILARLLSSSPRTRQQPRQQQQQRPSAAPSAARSSPQQQPQPSTASPPSSTSSPVAAAPAPAAPAPQPRPVQQESPPAPAAPAPAPAPPPQQEDNMADFLFGDPAPGAAAAPAAPAAAPTGLEDLFGTSAPPAAASGNGDAMFGGIFGDEGPDLSGAAHRVTVKAESHADDTEERAALRRARAQRVQDRIDKQLQEKMERDAAEASERELQSDLKQTACDKVTAWKKQSNGNIMGLLANLHTVIWEGSGWEPKSMGDLLENNGIKKAYRSAILKLHPDKVKQQHGDTETIVLADMIFDTLKEAWAKSGYS